jgi:hypothetical protein
MKESQLRQLIREEISKVMNEKENLSEIDPLMIQQAVELDPKIILGIIGSIAALLGGRAAAKSALEQAVQGTGPLSGLISPKKAQEILDFLNDLASGGGSGR